MNKRSELASRLKTLALSLAATASLWTAPLYAAGTTPLSLVQQFDTTGQPLSGCLLTFFVAGTVNTKQNAFQNFGLTQPLPNPVSCDQSGRVPQHWLADGLIHIQLTDSSGIIVIDTTMQVLGPSSGGGGGGGGGTVDPTTIFQTGALMPFYGIGTRSGFVRANGLTIGNASSGASERANADTQNLFIYLWNTDPNLVVSSGRGATPLADYNANKSIALPDWRGRALAALDDMGNSAAGRLTSTYFGTSATVLGAAGGTQSQTLSQGNLPSANLTTTITDPGHVHGGGQAANKNQNNGTFTNTVWWGPATNTSAAFTGITASTALGGSNTPHAIVSPMMLTTIYMKL